MLRVSLMLLGKSRDTEVKHSKKLNSKRAEIMVKQGLRRGRW